ncbi:MAG: hypothetical protein WCH34_05510 [Bacteroidota bacterium]
MNVFYSAKVEDYWFDLVKVLHEKHYFSDLNNAINYVLKLRTEIEQTIHLRQTYKTPTVLKQYGLHYKKFSISERTTWVVIYTIIEDTYYINFITNNHSKEAAYLHGLN